MSDQEPLHIETGNIVTKHIDSGKIQVQSLGEPPREEITNFLMAMDRPKRSKLKTAFAIVWRVFWTLMILVGGYVLVREVTEVFKHYEDWYQVLALTTSSWFIGATVGTVLVQVWRSLHDN